MNKKRLLFVQSMLTGGGSERVMVLLANEFANNGYSVDMVVLRKSKEITYKPNLNVNVIQLNNDGNKFIKGINRIKNLRKVIKTGNYDYIISFMYDINCLTLFSALGLKKKIIVSERCSPKDRPKKIYNIPEKILFRHAYKIVTQTKDVIPLYSKNIQKKCIVIENPINNNLPKRSTRINNNIIGVGRLCNQKNFKLLIDGFNEFSKSHSDYKLIIFGEGELKEQLQNQIEDLDLNNKVVLAGFVSDVNDQMKNAAMYISTSNFEGISNSMLEALGMGVPTICTDCPVGGAKMVINNDENGILIPMNDIDALVNAMNKIADDHEFREKISENALLVNKTYSLETIFKKWEDLIK